MQQVMLPFPNSHGGRREGSGRKVLGEKKQTRVAHRTREFCARHPLLVTSRLVEGVKSLRSDRLAPVVEQVLREKCEREGFRLCEYSIQSNHLHYVIEADSQRALEGGMKSLHQTLSRRVNRVLGRRGSLISKRFHHRSLRTPRQVFYALGYVLKNASKHTGDPSLDVLSSAASFPH